MPCASSTCPVPEPIHVSRQQRTDRLPENRLTARARGALIITTIGACRDAGKNLERDGWHHDQFQFSDIRAYRALSV